MFTRIKNLFFKELQSQNKYLSERLERVGSENVYLRSEVEKYSVECSNLREKIEELQIQITDPREYLKSIIGENLEWYDFKELEHALLEEYKRYSDQLSKNPVLKNEINFLINNYAKKSLAEAKSFEDVRDMRMQCLALKSLEARLAEIPVPDKDNEKVDDPYSAI